MTLTMPPWHNPWRTQPPCQPLCNVEPTAPRMMPERPAPCVISVSKPYVSILTLPHLLPRSQGSTPGVLMSLSPTPFLADNTFPCHPAPSRLDGGHVSARRATSTQDFTIPVSDEHHCIPTDAHGNVYEVTRSLTRLESMHVKLHDAKRRASAAPVRCGKTRRIPAGCSGSELLLPAATDLHADWQVPNPQSVCTESVQLRLEGVAFQ